ncbi:DNA cytosine methyltransferase [Neisseria meningitidis]
MQKTQHPLFWNLGSIGLLCFWKVLNAKDFGIPQNRKRIYLTGSLKSKPDLSQKTTTTQIKNIILEGAPPKKTPFNKKILKKFSPPQMCRKTKKNKRGGEKQFSQLGYLIKRRSNRRKETIFKIPSKRTEEKKWASEIGIDWMDGMPLTKAQIQPSIKTPISKIFWTA